MTLVFHAGRIRPTFHDFFDFKAGVFYVSLDRFRPKEIKVQGDPPAPKFVYVNSIAPDMKRQQDDPAGL